MSLFKKLLKKKEGGTVVGNLFRSAGPMIANAFAPGSGAVLAALNKAPQSVQKKGVELVDFAKSLPMQSFSSAAALADTASQSILTAGGSQSEAETVARQVTLQAQLPAVNSFDKKDGIAVLRGAAQGALENGMAVFLDKTKEGQVIEKAGIKATVEKYLPVAGLLLGCIGLFFAAKKK
jgi:hypothetical protein